MSEILSNEGDWTRAVTSDEGWSDSPSTYAKIKQSLEQSEEMSENPIKLWTWRFLRVISRALLK